MKKAIFLVVLGIVIVGGSIRLAGPNTHPTTEPIRGALTSNFNVQGMTCGGCETAIRVGVNKMDGVVNVQAFHKTGSAEVTYDPARVTPEQIVATIDKVGYHAELVETKDAPAPQQNIGS